MHPLYLPRKLLLVIVFLKTLTSVNAFSVQKSKTNGKRINEYPDIKRREFYDQLPAISSFFVSSILSQSSASNSIEMKPEGLASKLAKRDASLLKNSIFNIPPPVQVYPAFLHGAWDVTLSFRGYTFPSKTLSKSTLVQNYDLPGFRKCSIASISDIGQAETKYRMVIDTKTGYDDRCTTLRNSINAHLGYTAVREVIYDAKQNPNRLSIDFIPYQTRNANRIELFCNGRESDLVKTDEEILFFCSEYIRQVTFGLGMEFGTARQVNGNYAHFWTWRQSKEQADKLKGNVLTAVYLDPQDPLFFQEPSKPIAVYSHDISAIKA